MFRLACKSWNIKTPCKFIGEFSSPQLMLPRKILDPIREEFYPMEFPGARVYAVIEDWFLLQTGYLALSFYNPFTKETIKLPDGILCTPFSVYVSSPPTSADWIVVLTLVDTRDNAVVVHTIRCGEQRWSIAMYQQKEISFEMSSCNAVSYEGQLYFLGKNGGLMIQDLEKNEFCFHEAPESLKPELLNVCEQYLLVCDRKIVAVFVGNDGSLVRVCEWNSSMQKWEVLRSLRKKALFVSRALSVCKTVSEESGMDNKIYFTRLVDDHCVFYSMDTGKFHTFNGYSSATLYGAIKFYKHSTWIYPSQNQ